MPQSRSTNPTYKVSKASKARKLTSNLWAYAADVVDGQPPLGTTAGLTKTTVYRCSICFARGYKKIVEYSSRGGGAHFREHLSKAHKLTVATSTEEERETDRTESVRLTDMPGWNNNIRNGNTGRSTPSGITANLDVRALRALFLSWIVESNLPLELAQSDSFRRFLSFVNPNANQLLPRSPSTIRDDLNVAIDLRKPLIAATLHSARSRIHLVCDMWTSNNQYALFGVQCRFLDSDFHLQNLLLGLPELIDEHSGEAQTEALFSVTESYNCTESLGFVVADNASSIDAMAKSIESVSFLLFVSIALIFSSKWKRPAFNGMLICIVFGVWAT